MRISKIYLPEKSAQQVKLKEVDLTKKRLGSIVALVGKNGAGKTRILKFVTNYIKNLTIEQLLDDHIANIPIGNMDNRFRDSIMDAKEEYMKSKNVETREKLAYKSAYTNRMSPFLDKIKMIAETHIKIVDNDELKKISKTIENDIAFESLLSTKKTASNMFSVLNSQSTLDFIKKIATEIISQEYSLYIQNRDNPIAIKEKLIEHRAYNLFLKLQFYIKKFLGKELNYSPSESALTSTTLFDGSPLVFDYLSPGQKTLLAYAILFFVLDINTKSNMKDSIIIIDEPEKHLHPEAQIELIKSLREIVSSDGQLWIATHSIHILSELEKDEIILVKDGEVIVPANTTPGNSFNDLMGSENLISKLTDFVTSVSEWAFSNFISQCFKEPEAIFSNDSNDPQFRIFKQFILTEKHINLLDFGAGRGRIGHTIQEDKEVKRRIHYHAYEPQQSQNLELLKKIPEIHSVYDTLVAIPENTFDCVLLCNVLHEINPLDWLDNLAHIKRILKPNGFLLILEDKYLPKGENAHPFGYIILDVEQLRLLFNVETEFINLKLKEPKYSERIVFCAFRKEQINPTLKSIKYAIESLKNQSYNLIKKLRNQENKDIDQGRKYANQTQLYINAELLLEVLK